VTAKFKSKPNESTSAPLEVPPQFVAAAIAITPETIRLPKVGGHDPYFGMTRSALNELILPTPQNGFKPSVRSFVLRRKGSRTGIRLIDYQDLRRHILAHEETGTEIQSQTNE
jgi:hypothetical protein